MPNDTTKTWLQIASGILIAFGPLVALGALPATAGANGMMVDIVFWPFDGAPTLDTPVSRLMSAVAGGVMTGWGIMMWLVATNLYFRDPRLARKLILTATFVWFAIDSLGSLAAGAPVNALFNVGFLLMFWWPLRHPEEANTGSAP